MKWYDLSVPLAASTDVFPGDPPFHSTPAATLARDGYRVQELTMGTHSGTHIDLPRHFLADGASVDALPPDRFAGPAVFADVTGMIERHGVIDLPRLELPLLTPGDFLVIYTGWEHRRATTAFFTDLPPLTEESADWLAAHGVGLLGTDLPTVLASPDIGGPTAPRTESEGGAAARMHRALLSRDILILEGLVGLHSLCGRRLTLFAFPLRLVGADGSPVRAVAMEQ